MTSPFDHSLHQAAITADADPTGAAWSALLRRENIGEVLLRPQSLIPAQRAGLQRMGARLQAQAGAAQWWRLPAAGGDR